MTEFFYDSCSLILKFLIPGMFLGIIYDIFRLIRIARNDKTFDPVTAVRKRFFMKSAPVNKRKKADFFNIMIIWIEDIFFFLIVAITEILTLFQLNGGEIRIYCLLFSAVGFFIYQKTIGNLFIFLSKKIIYLIRKMIFILICAILIPLLGIIRVAKKLISVLRKNPVVPPTEI